MSITQPEHHEIEKAAYYCHVRGGGRGGHALKDWLQGEQLAFMENNYCFLGHYMLQGTTKEKLWLTEPRICRYCRDEKPQNRGWREAHAIPELVGNKTIIAMDECTKCNDHFSRHVENDFGAFLNLANAVCRTPGKRGVPSFKTKTGNSRIGVVGGNYFIEQYAGAPLAEFDPTTNTLALQAETSLFTPIAVYKCLSKMAIAIMPPIYLPYFEHTIKWLMNSNHADEADAIKGSAVCKVLFQPGPMPTDTGACMLLSRKSPDAMIPGSLFILTIANLSFQIAVPFSSIDNHLRGCRVPLPEFPAFYGFGYDVGEPSTKMLRLSSPDRQTITASAILQADCAAKEA